MFAQVHKFRSAAFRGLIPTRAEARSATHTTDGLVRVKSAYSVDETIDRIKKAIAAKGIPFFGAVDQARLAARAGVKLRPSTLLVFGSPSLGAQFLSANPYAGLDWPIRLLSCRTRRGRSGWPTRTSAGRCAAAALLTGPSNRRWPPASSTRLLRRCAPHRGHPEPAAMTR